MNVLDLETYRFLYAARHAAEAGTARSWDRLFARVDRKGFLGGQAAFFGDFDRTMEDLERRYLPEAIRRGDWERFLRYALVAASLRGLAEDVDEPSILGVLVRGGRLALAEKLVAQLPDPLRRATARAELAGTQPRSSDAFGRLIEGVRKDLDTPRRQATEVPDGTAAEAWCDALVTIAERLGPDLRQRWAEWIAELTVDNRGLDRHADRADRVRRAVAESFLDRGELEARELWSALSGIRSAETVRLFLPQRLASTAPPEPWSLLRRIRDLTADWGRELAWEAALALLARQAIGADAAAGSENDAVSWQRAVAELGPAPWSESFVEAGRPLWPCLSEAPLARLHSEVAQPVIRTALAVTRMEESGSCTDADRLVSEIEEISAPRPRLHWALRYLLARPREPRRDLEAQTAGVVHYLARLRWVAPAQDLRRFVDLVARVFPKDARSQLENVLWTPGGNAETLRTLAHQSGRRAVVDELFQRTEDYAAMAGATAAEGFELRREVLMIIAARLCVEDRCLDHLESAAKRLLPEEEDDLRCEVARALAAAGAPSLALEAASGLRARRRALLTRLEIAPPEGSLTPPQLYAAVAANTSVADEHHALAALLEQPVDPAQIAAAHCEPIERKGRQIEALVDLARHALAFQRRKFRRGLQDRIATIVPLKEALGVVESDAWLAALTPELVSVGSTLGHPQAVAEIREAIERVAGMVEVARERRRGVILQLIAGIESALSEDGAPLSPPSRRRLLALVEWIGRLPQAGEDGPGRTELRRDWHRFLPWLRLIEERAGVAPGRGLDRLRRKWSWLSAEQQSIADLCFPPDPERCAEGAGLTPAGTTDRLRALACLALRDTPEQVPELVAQVPPGPERDHVVLELIRFSPRGALPAEVAGELAAMVEAPTRPWVTTWLSALAPCARAETDGVEALANLVAESLLDLDDPTTSPIRRWVWRVSQDFALPKLADAALSALESGGRRGCEQGLRIFLNAYLAPQLGQEAEDTSRRLADVESALEWARTLGEPPTAEPATEPRGS
jgi:hypothetical protein